MRLTNKYRTQVIELYATISASEDSEIRNMYLYEDITVEKSSRIG